ncbi:MAG: AsmA family protein, partial [Deltaproteobacteria bacterium]|nr:AsmA family protein [Deltaproteobacteria bacterium]
KFKIRFGKVIMPQMVIDKLALDSTMKNGALSIRPLKADMGGGSVSLEMGLTPKGKAADLATVINVREIELAKILAETGSNDALEGKINADIDIKGNGDSVASIMSGLKGFSRIIMSEGKIDNKIIDKLGGETSKNVFRLLNPSIDQKKYTTVRCMVARFDIKDGIADATALVFDTSMMSVIGEGNINLKTERLNLSLAPSTKGGVAGYNLKLGELTQPFKLGGTLAEPSLVMDKEKTAVSIGKLLGKKLLKDKTGSKATSEGESNEIDVCAAALQAAETGVKMTDKTGTASKEEPAQVTPQKLIEDAKKDPEKLIEDVVKDPKKALKDLFGR